MAIYTMKESHKHMPLISNTALAIGLILQIFNYFISNDIMSLISTFIFFSLIMLCKKEMILPYYIFLSFFSSIIQYNGINLFAFLCIAVVARMILYRIGKVVSITLMFALHVVLHILSGKVEFTFGFVIPSILIVTLYASCILFQEDQRDMCLVMYLWGLLSSSVIGLLRAFSISRIGEILSNDRVYLGKTEGLLRYAGLSYDCNYFTVLIILGIGIVLFSKGLNNIKPACRYLFFVCFICFGVLTFSKSFFLCVSVLLIYWGVVSGVKKPLQIIISIIGGAAICIVFSDYLNVVFSQIIVRFSDGADINSFTTGRAEVWEYYWNRYISTSESIWFGNGTGDPGYWKATHNLALEILYNYGIIGFLCDFIYLLAIKRTFFRKNTRELRKGTVLLTVLFWALQMFLSSYTFHGLTIGVFITLILRSSEKSLSSVCVDSKAITTIV